MSERAKDRARRRTIEFDVKGIPTVPFRLKLVPPKKCGAMWALVGFSLDSAGGTAYMAPVLLGKELTGQLPYGHYQILVLFLAQKLNPDHHPRLLGMAEGFEAIMPGDVKLRIVGRWATYANTERLRSLPGVGGTPDHIAFTAPSVDRARHE